MEIYQLRDEERASGDYECLGTQTIITEIPWQPGQELLDEEVRVFVFVNGGLEQISKNAPSGAERWDFATIGGLINTSRFSDVTTFRANYFAQSQPKCTEQQPPYANHPGDPIDLNSE